MVMKTQQEKMTFPIQKGGTATIGTRPEDYRDPFRRTNNRPPHIMANAASNLQLIGQMEKELKIDIITFLSTEKGLSKSQTHVNSARQLASVITEQMDAFGLGHLVPESIRKGTDVRALIGKAPGQNGGTFNSSEFEKFFKKYAVLSAKIYDMAVKNDPEFSKNFDRDKFLQELKGAGFKPGDFRGECNDQLDGEIKKALIIWRSLERSRITAAGPTMPAPIDFEIKGGISAYTPGNLNGGTSSSVASSTSSIIEQDPVNKPVPNRPGKSRTYGGPGLEQGLKMCLEGCWIGRVNR